MLGKRGLFSILAFGIVLLPKCLMGQTYKELTIEKGKVYHLRKSLTKYDKITINGILKVEDRKNIRVETTELIVNGGTLRIGSIENPFRNELQISFRKTEGLNPGLKVQPNSTVHIYGSSKENDSLYRTIQINTINDRVAANVQINNAKTVNFNSITFNTLGYPSHAAIEWKGISKRSFIKNCVFTNAPYQTLVLEDTNIVLRDNYIESENTTALSLQNLISKSTNHVLKNIIQTKSTDSIYSIKSNNLFQKIERNTLRLGNNASGILIEPDSKSNLLLKKSTKDGFSLTGNKIHGSGKKIKNPNSVETVGIVLGDFNQKSILKLTNNEISNLSIGAIAKGRNVIFNGFHFQNNTIGIYPGKNYISNSSFKMGTKQSGSQAIVANERFSTSAPKISEAQIENYDTGIYFEGAIGASNYIEKTIFIGTDPVSFGPLSDEVYILDRDGSLFPNQTPIRSKNNYHQHHGHHLGNGSPEVKSTQNRTLIHSMNSLLTTKKSTPVFENGTIVKSNETQTGVLNIATGFGLSDPVHEHDGNFTSLRVENVDTKIHQEIIKNCVEQDFLLAANTWYEIDYSTKSEELFDLGFEWEAAPETWIIINVPYKNKNPVALRSFGKLIKSSKNLQELIEAAHTTYYIDSAQKTATLKLYNKKNEEELVLYSRSVLTEIIADGNRVPIELNTDWKNKQILISFEAPIDSTSTLEVLDYYGNVVEVLFDGKTKNQTTESTLDFNRFDIENEVFRYSLTVNGENHKGPIYAY